MTGYGNVDTEAGGQGQPFPTAGAGGNGNVQSDTANINFALGMGRAYAQPDPMQHYFELGQQLLQQQMAMQQQLPQQPMQQAAPGMSQGNLALDGGMLTAGFNPDWLAQRLDAASANGASIQKGGGGSISQGAAKKKAPGDASDLPAGGVEAGWATPTVQSYGGMQGASRLM